MNKLLVVLIAGAFAAVAAAQGTNPVTNPSPATKEKQKDVQATTSANAPSSVDAQVVNKQQQQNVKESKATPKQNTELKTKEGQKQLSKELQQKASP